MDEFMVYLIGDIAISAIIAAFTYGFGPVTVSVFFGRPIQKKKFKIFCIIYTIVIWFSWQMYRESSGNGVSIVPAILWGYISYLVANRIIVKKYGKEQTQKSEKPEPVVSEPKPQLEETTKEPEIQRWYTCPKCGQLVKDGEECDCEAVKLALEEKRQKEAEKAQQRKQALKKALPFYAVCAVLIVAVCALGFYSYNLKGQIDELSNKNAELTDENAKLKVEMSEYQNKSGKFNFRKIDIDDVREELSEIQLSTGYNWIGSTSGDKYHWITCKFAAYIPKSDRVYFKTEKEAEESGRKKCLVCKDIDSYTKGYFEARSNNKIVLEQGID